MIEEIAANIFRISVPLPENPLKEVNSYFIRGDSSDLLIDTGFRRPECREALRSGLAVIGAEKERLDVVATHVHSDHSGMVDEFAGINRKIYLSRVDLAYLREIVNGQHLLALHNRYVSEGFPEETVDYIEKTNPARIYLLHYIDSITILPNEFLWYRIRLNGKHESAAANPFLAAALEHSLTIT